MRALFVALALSCGVAAIAQADERILAWQSDVRVRPDSVLEVVETVKRISGRDFPVVEGPRRTGDIPAIVADASRMRHRLSWKPKHNDLDTIVRHALAWEAKLAALGESETRADIGASAPPVSPALDTLTDRCTMV